MSRESDDLDRYITGNYGEDQFKTHMHKCNKRDCSELVECEDDCVEDDQETMLYCPAHSKPGDRWAPKDKP